MHRVISFVNVWMNSCPFRLQDRHSEGPESSEVSPISINCLGKSLKRGIIDSVRQKTECVD